MTLFGSDIPAGEVIRELGERWLIQRDWFPHREEETAREEADTPGECHVPTNRGPGGGQLQAQDRQEARSQEEEGRVLGSGGVRPCLHLDSRTRGHISGIARAVVLHPSSPKKCLLKCDTCPLSENLTRHRFLFCFFLL